MSREKSRGAYAQAGVDVDAAELLVGRFAALARSTRRPEVLADIGPFSGLFNLSGFTNPVLVASADGVGTKLKLAALLGQYDSVGHDLVNHCVDDILTAGAEPLFFLDYIGANGLSDEAKLEIVRGLAEACRAAGCALLGGETADMPGVYSEGDFDLVRFIVGAVERDAVIDGSRIQEGDILLALPSNGLHTNGYSLVRKVFGVGTGGNPDEERERLSRRYSELDGALGEALMAPHHCYYSDLKPLLSSLRGIAHITGGGLPANLPRILPNHLAAHINKSAWEVPPLFRLIQEQGDIENDEMYRTYNMGVGIVLAVAPTDVAAIHSQLGQAFAIGEVIPSRVGTERLVWE